MAQGGFTSDVEPWSWMLCGGMIRAGSTLQYQLMRALLARRCEARGWIATPALTALLEGPPPASPTLIKTHDATPAVLNACASGAARVVYCFRDVRDVIASYTQKNRLDWDARRMAGLAKHLLDEDTRWRSVAGVHVARYERMAFDIAGEAAALAAWLGLDPDPARDRQLGRCFSMPAQRSRIRKAKRWVKVDATNAYDPHSQLHENHLQSGEVGRHRCALTSEQITAIEGVAGAWLARNGYDLAADAVAGTGDPAGAASSAASQSKLGDR